MWMFETNFVGKIFNHHVSPLGTFIGTPCIFTVSLGAASKLNCWRLRVVVLCSSDGWVLKRPLMYFVKRFEAFRIKLYLNLLLLIFLPSSLPGMRWRPHTSPMNTTRTTSSWKVKTNGRNYWIIVINSPIHHSGLVEGAQHLMQEGLCLLALDLRELMKRPHHYWEQPLRSMLLISCTQHQCYDGSPRNVQNMFARHKEYP